MEARKQFGESDHSSDELRPVYQKEMHIINQILLISSDYVFNDDMVTLDKQIRIVNNFLLISKRLQC
jgi:hypothetical protein